MKFISIIVFLGCISHEVFGNGELGILHSPDSIKFTGSEKVDQSLLKEIYSAVMGYSIEQTSSWNGLFIEDPFSFVEAIVHVDITGVKSLHSPMLKLVHKFPVYTNEDEYETWIQLKQRVLEHEPQENNTLFRLELSRGLETLDAYPQFLEGINIQLSDYHGMNFEVEEERKFLEELVLLNAFIDKLKSGAVVFDGKQDVFWIVFDSLHAVYDIHGSESKPAIKARDLLVKSLIRLTNAMNDVFKGHVLVDYVTSDSTHTRKVRAAGDPAKTITGLADDYDEDYPVIFNIILWFMVAFIFSLLAISVFIGTMDPGRDSIIYRMTSNRMKKDN